MKKNGMALLPVLGLSAVIAIFSMVVPQFVGQSNKEINFQRARAAALILEMSIKNTLQNPRSYSQTSPNFVLENSVKSALESKTKSVPGVMCRDSSFCQVVVESIGPNSTNDGFDVEIAIESDTGKRVIHSFSQKGPGSFGSGEVGCFTESAPVFSGIDATGNAICQPISNTTCDDNKVIIGIDQDLQPVCVLLPNQINADEDHYISALKFENGTLNFTQRPRADLELIEGETIKLKPVSFEPRSGRVNNVDYIQGPLYHNDGHTVKCPDDYPEIIVDKYELEETIPGEGSCNTKYSKDGAAAMVSCQSPNPSNVMKLHVEYECSKGAD